MLSQTTLHPSSISDDQFIADLTSLFRRRNISFGDPKDLDRLGSDMDADDAFRAGLFNLCAVISHMAEVELTPQELLNLVARASGGPGVLDAEGKVAVPQSTESTFLTGYEAWAKRGHGPDAALDRWASGPFHTALTLSATEGSRLGLNHPAPTAPSPRSIPSNAPLDSLTLGELRQYLDEIERRVGRIGPQLDQVTRKISPSAAHFEQLDTLESQRIHEVMPVAPDTEPEPTPSVEAHTTPPEPAFAVVAAVVIADEPAVPAVADLLPIVPEKPELSLAPPSRGLLLLASPPSPAQDAAPDTARLSRMRTAIIVLTILLVLAIACAAVFAFRYVDSQDQPAGSISMADSAPAPESPIVALPSAAKPTLPAVSHPSQTSQAKPSAATQPAAAEPSQPPASSEIAPAPITRQPPGSAPASPAPGPAETAAAPMSPPPSDTRPTESSVRPEQRAEPTPVRPTPTPAAAQVAEATPAAPTAPATVSAPVQRSPQPESPTIRVSSSKMMAYAVSPPAPVNPPNRHSNVDTTVEVVAAISKDGKVTSAQALSGSPDVRSAAVEAMQASRFKPYLVDGKPVEVVTTFRFLFKAQ